MKKVIVSFIAGAVLMFSAQAFGDGISFTGKKVDGETPVTVNGKEIGKAVVINGKSFAPVREITSGFGGKVDSANSEVIVLSTGEQKENLNTDNSSTNIVRLKEDIKKQRDIVERVTEIVNDLQKKVDQSTSQSYNSIPKDNELYLMKGELERETKKLEDLEAQLVELQK